MNNIMIDLETLGTGNGCVFVTIGAVYFDPATGAIGEEFYMNVDIQSALDAGRIVTGDTLRWWLEQKPEALKEIVKAGAPIRTALTALDSFIKGNCKVWGNGSVFDISILENAYEGLGMNVPWKFWNIRDVRTIKDIGQDMVDKTVFEFHGTAHNALDDAKHQAKYVSKLYQALRRSKCK